MMKCIIAFLLGAVCGIAALIVLCCVAVGKMAEKEEQMLREMHQGVDHEGC